MKQEDARHGVLYDKSQATLNSKEDVSGRVMVSASLRDTICDGGKSNLTDYKENANPEQFTTTKMLKSRSSEALLLILSENPLIQQQVK